LKKFTFRLQRFLEILCKRLEQKKIELSFIQNQLHLKEDEIETHRKYISDCESDFQKKMLEKKINSSDMLFWNNYIDFQYHKEGKLLNEKKTIEITVEKIKNEYLEIDKNIKMLEKLKEKQKYQFDSEVMKIENGYMDEVAVRRFFKKDDEIGGS